MKFFGRRRQSCLIINPVPQEIPAKFNQSRGFPPADKPAGLPAGGRQGMFFTPFFEPGIGFFYLRFFEIAGAIHLHDDFFGGENLAAMITVGLGVTQPQFKIGRFGLGLLF